MKFLLDMPVSPSLLNVLKANGHEGVHAHPTIRNFRNVRGKLIVMIASLPLV
jgi:hypothetical protein